MASINSVSGSNTISSLYNSSNIISGLASGLDTESMIENLVKSYSTKIQELTNKATKIEWKQEIYRSIINKMYAFSNKYTSYSSATNLLSSSFFSSAVKVAALGANGDKVTASGRAESDVKLNSVKQLATAARYNTASNLSNIGGDFSISAKEAVKFESEFDTGTLSGSLALSYGNRTVSVVFDPSTDIIDDYVYETNDDGSYKLDSKGQRIVERERTAAEKAADLQALIEKKLGDATITLSSGESKKASELINVNRSGGTISFSDKSTAGNSVTISSASGTVGTTLGINAEKKPTSFSVEEGTQFVETQDVGSYISGATMTVSLDGKVKTIQLPTILDLGGVYQIGDGNFVELTGDRYTAAVQAALDKEFGAGKIQVSNGTSDPNALKLSFKAPDNSDLIINTNVGKALGIDNVASNYLNTNSTLGDLMKKSAWDGLEALKGSGSITEGADGRRYDSKGRLVDKDGDLVDSKGNKLYEFKLNGVTIGNYSKDTKLSTIMSDINNNADANVKISYSQTTRQFSFVSKDTGSENKIELGEGLAQAMFGAAHGSEKISDVLGEDTVSKETSFKIGDDTFSVKFESNSETMTDLLKKLNAQLKGAGYTASYNVKEGLVVKDQEGNKAELKYLDDDSGEDIDGEGGSNILRDIIEKAEPKTQVQNHANRYLTEIVGEDPIAGQTFSVTIDGIEYTGKISSNTGTLKSLVNKFNNEIFKNGEHTAYYDEERGLYFMDKNNNEAEVKYGDDFLGKVAEAVEVQNHSKDRLTDLAGKDIVNVQTLEFTVNGSKKSVRIESNDLTMDDLLEKINSTLTDGYKASYSATNGGLVVTDASGNESSVKYDEDGALGKIVNAYKDKYKEGNGSTYVEGKDAIFTVEVNGQEMELTRGSNTTSIDGLTLTFKDTFNEDYEIGGKLETEAVTFQTSTDSDKIVDAIKSMIADYNEMMAEIKSAYGTLPYTNSSGAFQSYEPLSDEDKATMSESAIQNYEAKAKQGILFNDYNLSSLYSRLQEVFNLSGKDGAVLSQMGISWTYSTDGTSYMALDEDKLRDALESDPDAVADLFTRSVDSGGSSNGIMQSMKTQLDRYGSVTGAVKGILVEQAGSPLSSLSLLNNEWQKQIDRLGSQIETWQDKLSNQVDKYTQMFSRLEVLMNQMNSQSASLAGLMGGQ